MHTNKILKHFKQQDPILYEIAVQFEDEIQKVIPTDKSLYFTHLVSSILSQQLSTKASDTIWSRFILLFDNNIPTPQKILELDDIIIRKKGVSIQKISYLKDLSNKIVNKEIDLDKLEQFDNKDIILQLTKVKGIGQWTAEMFLIFALGKENVFPTNDLGINNAIKNLYSKENLNIELWSPYKSYAAKLLWKSLDNK